MSESNNLSLEEAIRSFVSSLSDLEKRELVDVVLNPQLKESRKFYRLVIEKFELASESSKLVLDISERYPDEAVFRDIESDSLEPVFEAKVILREAQNLLRASTFR